MLLNILLLKYRIYKKLSTTTFLLLLSINILFISCKEKKSIQKNNNKTIKEYSAKIHTPALTKGIKSKFNGVIKPIEKQLLSFKNGGQITFINGENKLLKKGTNIARVNNTEISNKLKVINVKLKDLTKDLDKLRDLQKDSIGSISNIEKLELKLKAEKSNHRIASYNMGLSVIKAPFDGYIGKKLKQLDEVVRPTEPIVEYNSIEKNVVFFVSEKTISNLSIGQSIKISCTSCAKNLSFSGKITSVGFQASQNGLYKVKAKFNSNNKVKEDFRVEIELLQNADQNYFILPLRYVNRVLENDSLSAFILKNGMASEVALSFIKIHNNGYILSKDYENLNFIELFDGLTEGVKIKIN